LRHGARLRQGAKESALRIFGIQKFTTPFSVRKKKGFKFKSVSLRYSAGNTRASAKSRQTLRKEVLIHNL